MTPARMAQIHAACFSTHPPPWSAEAITQTLASSGAFLLTRGGGFLIGRVILDEAELLTLAVDPAAQRQGLGGWLVRAFAQEAERRGARRGYLEVATDNGPALSLYASLGWAVVAIRRNYYDAGIDAQIMARSFGDDGHALKEKCIAPRA